jgi:hypothetical protein
MNFNNLLNNKQNTFDAKQPLGLNSYTSKLKQSSNLATGMSLVIISS